MTQIIECCPDKVLPSNQIRYGKTLASPLGYYPERVWWLGSGSDLLCQYSDRAILFMPLALVRMMADSVFTLGEKKLELCTPIIARTLFFKWGSRAGHFRGIRQTFERVQPQLSHVYQVLLY